MTMENEMFKHIPQGRQRELYMLDNCDKVEKKSYMRQYSHDQLAQMKERLSDLMVEVNDIDEEKKAMLAVFKERLEPLMDEKKELLFGLKTKAEFVKEDCYKFVDLQARVVQFYNSNGDLVEERPTFSDELEGTIFQINRTGTEK